MLPCPNWFWHFDFISAQKWLLPLIFAWKLVAAVVDSGLYWCVVNARANLLILILCTWDPFPDSSANRLFPIQDLGMYKFSVIIPEAPNIPRKEKVHLGLEAMPHNIDVFQTFDIVVLMKTHAAELGRCFDAWSADIRLPHNSSHESFPMWDPPWQKLSRQ